MSFYRTQLVACNDFIVHKRSRVLIPVTIVDINGEMATVLYNDEQNELMRADIRLDELKRFNVDGRKLHKDDVVYAPWINDDRSVAYELYRAVVQRDQGLSDVIRVKFDGDKLQRYCTSKWVVIPE